MSANTDSVLNPTLYRRLVRRFGDVKVRYPGEARVVRQDPFSDEPRLVAQNWGESYYVCCPFCGDRHHQLSISYMYAQRDEETGRQLLHLAYCHAAKCMSRYKNRVALAEMLSANDGLLEEARLRQGKVVSDAERVVELPSPLTRLDKLPKKHPARRYLRQRGFNPDKVGKFYDVHYCNGGDDPLARDRIIIPVYRSGRLRGWQSLALEPGEGDRGDDGQTPTFLSALGMKTSDLWYNLDRARDYATGVIVRWPTDVWAFGLMALCPVGNSVTEMHQRVIRAVFRARAVVLFMAKEELAERGVRQLRSALERGVPDRVAVVERPGDRPPGAEARRLLRGCVLKQAKSQKVRVAYDKVP